MSDEIEQQATPAAEFSDELSDEALDRHAAGGALPICLFCWNE